MERKKDYYPPKLTKWGKVSDLTQGNDKKLLGSTLTSIEKYKKPKKK
jgi:hypothetical protein